MPLIKTSDNRTSFASRLTEYKIVKKSIYVVMLVTWFCQHVSFLVCKQTQICVSSRLFAVLVDEEPDLPDILRSVVR